jgi:hypothetical protein
MSDVELLFVVLASLYVWECACWLRRGTVAFSTWLGRGWRAVQPGTLIGNQNGGFILAPPLPPLGTLFVAHQFPFSIAADGVLAFVATNVNPGWRPAQSGRFVRFEDLRETRADGRRVIINGERWLAGSSPGLARRCVEHLQQLAKLKPAQREAAIVESLQNAFDAGAVERLRPEFQNRARAVRGLSNGLLGYVFVVVPAVVWHFGFKLSWLGLLGGLLGLTSATAFFFSRAHRALYPKAEDERFTHTLTILLAPTTAMRAHDALSRPLLEDLHPLALAKVFLPEKDFREFARRVLLDIRQPAWPLCPNESPGAREVEAQARRALQTVVEKFLKRHGIEPDALCQPPAPADDTCRAYCPRCQAQFTTAAGMCADCGGLPLVAFEKRSGAERL